MRRLFACLLCLVTATALADGTEPFQWSVTPYLWASQTQLDLSLQDQALGGDTISFSDLLDQIDTEQRPAFRVETRSDTTLLDTGVALSNAWNELFEFF